VTLPGRGHHGDWSPPIIAAPFSLNVLTVDGASRHIPGPRIYRHSFEDFHA